MIEEQPKYSDLSGDSKILEEIDEEQDIKFNQLSSKDQKEERFKQYFVDYELP